MLNPATIKALKKKKLDMPDFLKQLRKRKKTIVFPIYEIGQKLEVFKIMIQ